MFESSLLIGNIFIYFTFNGEKYIEDHTRTIVCAGLTAVSVLGTITLFGISLGLAQKISDKNYYEKFIKVSLQWEVAYFVNTYMYAFRSYIKIIRPIKHLKIKKNKK